MNGSTMTEERQDRPKEGVGSRLQSTPARADRARAPPPPAALRHTSPLPHTRGDRAGGARRARGPILPWIAPPCTQPLPRSRRQTMQASSKQAVTYQRPGWWRRGRGGRQRSSWLKGCWDCACGCACGCGVGVSAGIDGTKGPTRLRDETTPGGGRPARRPRVQPASPHAAAPPFERGPNAPGHDAAGWWAGRAAVCGGGRGPGLGMGRPDQQQQGAASERCRPVRGRLALSPNSPPRLAARCLPRLLLPALRCGARRASKRAQARVGSVWTGGLGGKETREKGEARAREGARWGRGLRIQPWIHQQAEGRREKISQPASPRRRRDDERREQAITVGREVEGEGHYSTWRPSSAFGPIWGKGAIDASSIWGGWRDTLGGDWVACRWATRVRTPRIPVQADQGEARSFALGG